MDFPILAIGFLLIYLNVFPFNKELERDQIYPEDLTVQQLPDQNYRIRKKIFLEHNHQKKIIRSPYFYGIQKYSVFSSEDIDDTILKDVTITCIFTVKCSNDFSHATYELGHISHVDVKVISFSNVVKIYSYRFYGKKI